MQSSDFHIINKPAVDYVRLTTFMPDVMERLERVFQFLSTDMTIKYPVKNMQYVGARIEHGFIGKGKQKTQMNMMLEVSGSLANEAIDEVRVQTQDTAFLGGCPRLDIQYTIERYDTDENLALLGTRLREHIELNVKNPKKRPEVRLRDNSRIENDNTVYIGARTSERMVRIYDKKINNKEYIRYEIEYHDKASLLALNEIIRDEKATTAILKTDMERFIRYSPTLHRMYDNVPEGDPIVPTALIRDRSDALKRLEYLEFIARSMSRKLTLEGFDAEVQFILESILDEVKTIKR